MTVDLNADMYAVYSRLSEKSNATVAQVAERDTRNVEVGSSSDPGSSSSEKAEH